MNSKIHYILHGISLAAIAVLFVLVLGNGGGGKQGDTTNAETDYESAEVNENAGLPAAYGESDTNNLAKAGFGLRIVYVNADSILTRFDYYKKLRSNMEAKARRSEQELESEARKLELEYADAQKRAQGMSQEQLATLEQGLMRKQQNIMMLRENLSKELADEEEKLDKILRQKVQAYFKRLSKQEGYDYVLSYHYGSNVVYGNQTHDITARVIADLNREYAAEQGKKKK